MSKLANSLIILGALGAAIIVLPGLFYIGGTLLYGAGEDRTFEPQWRAGFKMADDILRANGLCPTATTCSENSVSIYVVGIPKGFKITIYGTTDRKLLDQLSHIFIEEFSDTPDMMHLIIHAYQPTRHQLGNYLLPPHDDLLSIDLERPTNEK